MDPTELLQQINTIQNTTFQLLERYSDGEQGAFAIRDGTGRYCVLKWKPGIYNLQRMQEARVVTDLFRTRLSQSSQPVLRSPDPSSGRLVTTLS